MPNSSRTTFHRRPALIPPDLHLSSEDERSILLRIGDMHLASLGGQASSASRCVRAALRRRSAGSYTTAGMDQLERDPAGQEPAISHETGIRPKGVSYVYKYQLATQVE
jgi:hypothetical protein